MCDYVINAEYKHIWEYCILYCTHYFEFYFRLTKILLTVIIIYSVNIIAHKAFRRVRLRDKDRLTQKPVKKVPSIVFKSYLQGEMCTQQVYNHVYSGK